MLFPPGVHGLLFPQNIEIKLFLRENEDLTSLKEDKALTEQQIILRIIIWCFKAFTYVVVKFNLKPLYRALLSP